MNWSYIFKFILLIYYLLTAIKGQRVAKPHIETVWCKPGFQYSWIFLRKPLHNEVAVIQSVKLVQSNTLK